MIILLCSVFDSKIAGYGPVFCYRSKGEAIRSFTDAVKDDKSPFAAHPSDYRLFSVGTFDDSTGVVSSVKPEALIGADELG